jgi:hypothetical protein
MSTTYNEQPEYKAVQNLIAEMDNDGAIARFQGACLPASEIIQAILHSKGVRSRLLECTALVTNSPINGGAVHFVGFDSLVPLQPNEVDTHMVVLVEAAKPFIVDASIGNKLGNPRYVVVASLSSADPDIIAEASFKGASVVYRVRKNIRYFNIHQKSLVDRLEGERKVQVDISTLRTVTRLLLALSVFNMFLNLTLVGLKTIFP